ncbi:SAM-dependent methyltransferase [Luteolibacter yonseiensis]|uniref:SAM-dependent methyltransferase n=1 Tax=Luteolibacter yonseiensis TaxID=1144680 RepID=A0A934R7G2_9BACT|nr:SAM-dependent methyltransferase [Luteolibacter yonseiensis]MBK1817727.1 SAM-dependent methyltransferase [Luteolibacter yonseiensis]
MQPVSFEQFMARALHDPQHGYYARRISGVGRRGDFTTAPMLSDAPARAIATWAVRAMKETGCRDLIEVGPGEGRLAADVLRHLPWQVRWKTRFHLVETSVPLAARQQELLGSRVRHHRTIQEALAVCGGNAVIYSNELVDAFPVRRFQKNGPDWQEMAVAFDERKRPVESLLPPSPLPDSSGFRENHPPGQQIEVHDSYHRHLAEWMPGWKSGRLLTIDYGDISRTLYHRRPRGSVRAYLHHQLIQGTGVYENAGHQDLTADVNFTDLIEWSRPWVDDHQLLTFHEFLKSADCGDSQLIDPDGAGNAFLVLDQKRAEG